MLSIADAPGPRRWKTAGATPLLERVCDFLQVLDNGQPLRTGILALATLDAVACVYAGLLCGASVALQSVGLVLEDELAVHGLEEVGDGYAHGAAVGAIVARRALELVNACQHLLHAGYGAKGGWIYVDKVR